MSSAVSTNLSQNNADNFTTQNKVSQWIQKFMKTDKIWMKYMKLALRFCLFIQIPTPPSEILLQMTNCIFSSFLLRRHCKHKQQRADLFLSYCTDEDAFGEVLKWPQEVLWPFGQECTEFDPYGNSAKSYPVGLVPEHLLADMGFMDDYLLNVSGTGVPGKDSLGKVPSTELRDGLLVNESFLIELPLNETQFLLPVFYRNYGIGLMGTTIDTFVEFNLLSHPLLHVNWTFLHFSLSDECRTHNPREKDCFDHTEHFLIKQFNKPIFQYCMKRPQWSVFTISKTDLHFHGCQEGLFCINHTSVVVFEYQVVDSHSLTTEQDQSVKILVPLHKVSESFLYETQKITGSFLFAMKFFVLAKKYETLIVTQSKQGKDIMLIPSVHGTEFDYVTKNRKVHTKYFYCFVYILANTTQTLTSALYFTKVSQTQSAKVIVMSSTESVHLTICSHWKSCHKLYILKTPQDMYAEIAVHMLLNHSWTMFSCFYAGIAFYDQETSTELYRLCQGSFKFSSPLGNTMPFLAPSAGTLLVAYSDLISFTTIAITIKPTSCRGVLINICSQQSYPSEYVLKSKPNDSNDGTLSINIPDSNVNQSCLKYQLGQKFLMNTNCFDLKKRCKLFFILERNFTQLESCQIQLQAQKTQDVRLAPDAAQGKVLIGDNIMNHSNLCELHSHQGAVDVRASFLDRFLENPKVDFLFPKLYFPTKLTQPFECTLHLQTNPRTKPLPNAFYIQRFPHETNEVWAFSQTYTACSPQLNLPHQSVSLCPFPSLISSLAQRLHQHHSVLMVSLDGNTRNMSGLLGSLRIESNLCLSSFWFHVTTIRDSKFREMLLSRLCNEKFDQEAYINRPYSIPNNMGEDKLVWKSNLNVGMYEMNNNILSFGVPGFVLEATFDQTVAECLQSSTVIYQWSRNSAVGEQETTNTTKHQKELGLAYFHENHNFSVLSPNLKKYFDPPTQWTWYEAYKECRLIGENLLTFVSGNDLQHFVQYVLRVSWNTLISTVFIGFFGKVRLHKKLLAKIEEPQSIFVK